MRMWSAWSETPPSHEKIWSPERRCVDAAIEMSKKITGRALARFEAERDIWQEVLDGARQIKAGRGKRIQVEPRSAIVRARLKVGLTQAQFAGLLGVSKRTLEQWEQGRREPSGAAKTLIRVAQLHPEILRKIAA